MDAEMGKLRKLCRHAYQRRTIRLLTGSRSGLLCWHVKFTKLNHGIKSLHWVRISCFQTDPIRVGSEVDSDRLHRPAGQGIRPTKLLLYIQLEILRAGKVLRETIDDQAGFDRV